MDIADYRNASLSSGLKYDWRKPVMRKAMSGATLVLFVIVVVTMLGCAGSRTQKSAGDVIDDGVIGSKVKTALLADEDVSGLQVEVETFKGVVQLSGFVDTAAQANKAERIARGVQGVKEVQNNLIVK
jgi:osmotically-inducible protein OsmY